MKLSRFVVESTEKQLYNLVVKMTVDKDRQNIVYDKDLIVIFKDEQTRLNLETQKEDIIYYLIVTTQKKYNPKSNREYLQTKILVVDPCEINQFVKEDFEIKKFSQLNQLLSLIKESYVF